ASPIALPMASFAAPLISLIEPATLFLSMTASPSVLRRRVTALGLAPLASGIETVGRNSRAGSLGNYSLDGVAHRGDFRSNDPIARRRREAAASDNPTLDPAKPNQADF